MKFTTKDQDNDTKGPSNCAQRFLGGWWYKACGQANLNGGYFENNGVSSYQLKGYYYSLKSTTMEIRSITGKFVTV